MRSVSISQQSMYMFAVYILPFPSVGWLATNSPGNCHLAAFAAIPWLFSHRRDMLLTHPRANGTFSEYYK